jgi:hypothetical protein
MATNESGIACPPVSCTIQPSPQMPLGGVPARCQPEPAASGARLRSACAVQRPRHERQAAGWRTPWLEERRHSSVAVRAGVLVDRHRGRHRTRRYRREGHMAASGTAKVVARDKLVNAIGTDRFVICYTHAHRRSKPWAVESSANQAALVTTGGDYSPSLVNLTRSAGSQLPIGAGPLLVSAVCGRVRYARAVRQPGTCRP